MYIYIIRGLFARTIGHTWQHDTCLTSLTTVVIASNIFMVGLLGECSIWSNKYHYAEIIKKLAWVNKLMQQLNWIQNKNEIYLLYYCIFKSLLIIFMLQCTPVSNAMSFISLYGGLGFSSVASQIKFCWMEKILICCSMHSIFPLLTVNLTLVRVSFGILVSSG